MIKEKGNHLLSGNFIRISILIKKRQMQLCMHILQMQQPSQYIRRVFQHFIIWWLLLVEKILNVQNMQTYGTRQLSKNILKALKDRKACLISNHGQIVFDENLPKAFELAEEVENLSLQYITALKIGRPKILSKKEMNKVLVKSKNYKRG